MICAILKLDRPVNDLMTLDLQRRCKSDDAHLINVLHENECDMILLDGTYPNKYVYLVSILYAIYISQKKKRGFDAFARQGVPQSPFGPPRHKKLMAACPGPKIKIANIHAKEMSVLKKRTTKNTPFFWHFLYGKYGSHFPVTH